MGHFLLYVDCHLMTGWFHSGGNHLPDDTTHGHECSVTAERRHVGARVAVQEAGDLVQVDRHVQRDVLQSQS